MLSVVVSVVPLGIGRSEIWFVAVFITTGFVALATERNSLVAERFSIELISFSNSSIDPIVSCMGFRIFDVLLMVMIANRTTTGTKYVVMILNLCGLYPSLVRSGSGTQD